MGALDEIAKLKAARRAEIELQKEVERRALDEEHRYSLARLEDAVRDALIGQCATWLAEYRVATNITPDRMPPVTRCVTVEFDVPGHHRLCLDFRRVEVSRGEWVLPHNDDGEWIGWHVQQASFTHNSWNPSLADALIAAEIEGWTPPLPPEPERDLSPEAEQRAREAWASMTTPDGEPMLPAVAIDYVQDEVGDRDDAVSALHWAAAAWLDSLRPEQPVGTSDGMVGSVTSDCRYHLSLQRHDQAEKFRAEIHRISQELLDAPHEPDGFIAQRASKYITWSNYASQAIDLCRAVAVAAHPEPVRTA